MSRSTKARALVVATAEESARVGLALVECRAAWAVIHVVDLGAGRIDVRYVLADDSEHRLGELEALVRSVAEANGGTIADPARLTRRGRA